MTARRLPVKQLVILSICRIAEPIAITSVFPYLPEMVEFFGVPQNDIARWAGFTSAIFNISQGFTGIPWGAASDRFGRKPIILIGLVNTMITMLIWGFSTNLPMALTARALQGLGNGNVGILRTTVAELCPWKELQPKAFSIMPLVWTVGAIFGPTLGGALANPLNIDPRKPRGDKFLERYPYCLPNLVAAFIFCIGIVTGWLFLKESLETRKNERDYGVILGDKLTAWVRKTFNFQKSQKKPDEREPLLAHQKSSGDEETASNASPPSPTSKDSPNLRDVLTKQTSLNLLVYTLLALYTMAFDQLLPVFMHHPRPPHASSRATSPLKFALGFGLSSHRIGAIFTLFSITSTLAQFLLFPPLARHFGVLTCLRISFLIFPFIFLITPFIALIPGKLEREAAMVALLMVRGIAGTFSFPTSTIMLTNSASSLRVLGTLNGLATSFSSVGRAAGPAMGGSLFTIGVQRGYVILPFWTLAGVSFLACLPTLWLVEGAGFGDEEEEGEGVEVVSASASIDGEVSDVGDAGDEAAALSENEYGEPTGLRRYTSTHSSAAVFSEAEDDLSADEALANFHQGRRTGSGSASAQGRRGTSSSMQGSSLHGGGHEGRRLSHGTRVRRRSSVPLGMGEGFHKLSSNLGSTGFGGGGSWGGT